MNFLAKIGFTVFVALTQLLLITPLFLFASNPGEFTFGFLDLAQHTALPISLAVLAVAALAFFVPRAARPVIIALGCAMLVGLYAQGYLLVWDYGLLDGSEIEWGKLWQRGAIDLGVWLLLVTTALVFRHKLARHAVKLVSAVLLLQICNVLQICLSSSVDWRSAHKLDKQAALHSIYSFSPHTNVVMILLDTFESPAFSYIIKQDPQYQEWFNDFVYYKNTLASFPTTAPSVPAILTGQNYDNSQPLKQFVDQTFRDNSLPSVLHKAGMQVDLATLPHYCTTTQTTSCLSLAELASADQGKTELRELLRLLDLSLFRHAPQALKRFIYNDQLWFLQRYAQKRVGPVAHVDSIEVVENMHASAKVDAPQPTFKFIHLMIPHLPLRLDAECNHSRDFRNVTTRDFSVQSRCALRLAKSIIDDLKRLNIYDSALIVVLADHGFRLNYGDFQRGAGIARMAEALPLLLIKAPQRSAPFQISTAPATLTDLPRTIATSLSVQSDFPGISLFELNPSMQRQRLFRQYTWKDDNWLKEYLPPMQEYRVMGDAWDPAAWSRSIALLPP